MKIESKEKLLDNSVVSLQVKVPQEEVKEEYDSLVTDYCKKVSIKGFRRGKVPPEVLIRKLGDSLMGETTQKLIEKGLEEAFEVVEHKPLPYTVPSLKDGAELELDLEKPFSFEVTYDTFPDVELGDYKEIEVREPVVSIGKEDMDRELAAIQEQNSVVIDKADGKVERDDTVTIDYVELDDAGREQEGTRREGFTFTVGSGYNLYKIDDDIVGMARDEEKVLEKEYPEDFEQSDLAGRKVKLEVRVTAVKEKKLPAIDDELAQDVSEKYSGLKDLKDDISKRLEESADQRVRQVKIQSIFDKIVEGSKIPVPESMVQQELAVRWQNFVRQFRMDESFVLRALESQGRTKDEVIQGWRPAVEKAIKVQLAENRIAEAEGIEVSDEELDRHIEEEAAKEGREPEELKEELAQNNVLGLLRDNLVSRKTRDLLLESAVVKKGEKVGFLDFMQGKD